MTYSCNLCGGLEFGDMKNRKSIRCLHCGSLERTRIMWLFIEKYGLVQQGFRVLHLAPERGLAQIIRKTIGSGYEPSDIDVERYRQIGIRKLDLVYDAETLQSNRYDLIIHNHVIEHLPCNYTAVLFHLHRALKRNGVQLFSIPIVSGHYADNFSPLSDEERTREFGQFDHVRRFGRASLTNTLGMIFPLSDAYDIEQLFGAARLDQHNIPSASRKGFTSDTIFMMKKSEIKLAQKREPD